ncbi:hypothetical protein LCGC14_2688150 [marine sediment metagenome]|uniref:Uncharacterized protein n=1 Tax=marine sediment metagenome TaxID=412755 RepID=A0A0F9BU29_9ZZZZ
MKGGINMDTGITIDTDEDKEDLSFTVTGAAGSGVIW